MPQTHTESPGNVPGQTHNTSTRKRHDLDLPGHVPWEIKVVSLLAAAVESYDQRIRYYEAQDRLAVQVIDRQRRLLGESVAIV